MKVENFRDSVISVKYYFILFCLSAILIKVSGCSSENTELSSFLSEKIPQERDHRIIQNKLILADSLQLTENFGIVASGTIKIDNNNIYIVNPYPNSEIVIIDKVTLMYKDSISPSQGRGPEEVTSIGSFDIHPPYLIISNENMNKIQIWNVDGDFIREFVFDEIQPHRVSIREDGHFTILSPLSARSDHVFHTINEHGDLVSSFGRIQKDYFNPLMYSGVIYTDGWYFYYAGFSEHILQKWNQRGEIQYSVSTIDDFPGEVNYISFSNSDQRTFQYSESGYYSAIGLAIVNNYIMIMHGGNRSESNYAQLIDVYDKLNGQYHASLEIPYNASSGSFAVDDHFIYVLHDDDGEIFLGIYENTLH